MACRHKRGLTLLEMLIVTAILAVLAGLVVPLLSGATDKAQDDVLNANMAEIRTTIMGKPDVPGFYTDLRLVPARMSDLFVNPTNAWIAGYPDNRTYPYKTPYNPNTRQGWRGPYILNATGRLRLAGESWSDGSLVDASFTAAYGQSGDPAMLDPWGRAIVLQWPSNAATTDPELKAQYVRLVSAGRDGIIQTSPDAVSIDANGNLKPYPSTAARGDDIVVFLRRADVP